MQYYRNKKFAAVKLTSQRTVTRHLTWFSAEEETKYPQRKTIQPEPTSTLNSFPQLTKINKTRKKNCHWRVPTRRVETEDWDGSRGMKIHKGRKKRGRNKTKGKQPQQRRRVISFSPIYMSAGKWYMSFFQFSSVQREMNETVLFIPTILEDR